jgi:transcription elongation GreA/GreB family factor
MSTLRPIDDDVLLTGPGRALIEGRVARLDEELDALADVPWTGRAGEEITRRRLYLATERSALRAALDEARPVESIPEDPGSVLIGDRVQIRVGNGRVESFVVVHPVEAALDDTRISTASPIGRAVLGCAVGSDVQVRAPGATYRCKILRSERE